MEMRVKHLEKMGEVAKAVVLAKACTECSSISNQATFRQTYVSLLCHLLPNEEAIMEVIPHFVFDKGERTACTRLTFVCKMLFDACCMTALVSQAFMLLLLRTAHQQ